MTKKALVLSSFCGTVLFSLALFLSLQGLCLLQYFCSRPHDDTLSAFFLPILPLFLFSLITYKMSEVVFQDWWRFARIFVPLAMFLILITPAYTHNWMFPVVKGTVAVALSVLFVAISLFRIILAHRRIKQGNS